MVPQTIPYLETQTTPNPHLPHTGSPCSTLHALPSSHTPTQLSCTAPIAARHPHTALLSHGTACQLRRAAPSPCRRPGGGQLCRGVTGVATERQPRCRSRPCNPRECIPPVFLPGPERAIHGPTVPLSGHRGQGPSWRLRGDSLLVSPLVGESPGLWEAVAACPERYQHRSAGDPHATTLRHDLGWSCLLQCSAIPPQQSLH